MRKTVTIDLDRISVIVEGSTETELLENAKKELIKQLQIKFPHFVYSIDDADVLSLEQAMPGTIVEDTDGKVGIITSLNPKNKRPVSVTMSSGISVAGVPQAFKLSKATFDEARHKRYEHQDKDWYEGDSGYLKNNGQLIEVVVGKATRGKYSVFMINNGGKGYQLTEQQMKALIKDDEE